jgi:hypothetical protein
MVSTQAANVRGSITDALLEPSGMQLLLKDTGQPASLNTFNIRI